jgi:integrase
LADNAIVPVATLGRTEIISLAETARGYADAGMAANTRRAYESDFADFASWCASVGACPLPAEAAHVALYLTARAPTLAVSTLARRLAAIRAAHKAEDLTPPASGALDQVWAGIRRTHGRPPARKRGLLTDDLKKVLKRLPPGLAGARDRALLLVGFAGALRRCELAALNLQPGAADSTVTAVFVADGLELHIARAKGDQEGRGAVVAVPYGKQICPVAALQAWLRVAKITSGPVFRGIDRHGRLAATSIGGRAAAEIIKRACQRAGFDPDHFGGHSLRRGLITSAARGGAAGEVLMRHARHAKFETTLGYIEEAQRFQKNAAGKAGL